MAFKVEVRQEPSFLPTWNLNHAIYTEHQGTNATQAIHHDWSANPPVTVKIRKPRTSKFFSLAPLLSINPCQSEQRCGITFPTICLGTIFLIGRIVHCRYFQKNCPLLQSNTTEATWYWRSISITQILFQIFASKRWVTRFDTLHCWVCICCWCCQSLVVITSDCV